MILRSLLGVTALTVIILAGSHAAKADNDDWRGPSVMFNFGGPAYYQPPPPAYYYAPPPVYAPPAQYYYPAQGYWHEHHHDDDDEGDGD